MSLASPLCTRPRERVLARLAAYKTTAPKTSTKASSPPTDCSDISKESPRMRLTYLRISCRPCASIKSSAPGRQLDALVRCCAKNLRPLIERVRDLAASDLDVSGSLQS